MKTQIRSSVSKVAMAMLGRRLVVRIGRAIAREARLDVANQISNNGELLVQRTALAFGAAADERLVIFDAGANVGDWTLALEQSASATTRPIDVFAFEPSRDTFQVFKRNTQNVKGALAVHAIQSALSDVSGEAVLHVASVGAGTNSLHAQDEISSTGTETISCTTVDEFCQARNIARMRLLKIDTEGHEMSVFAGASSMLDRKAIDLVQFEYNQRWIYSRHYLRDAFEVFQSRGYHIGKITPRGIEFYDAWHYELETWNEGNYLACLPVWTERFPAIKWWNA